MSDAEARPHQIMETCLDPNEKGPVGHRLQPVIRYFTHTIRGRQPRTSSRRGTLLSTPAVKLNAEPCTHHTATEVFTNTCSCPVSGVSESN